MKIKFLKSQALLQFVIKYNVICNGYGNGNYYSNYTKVNNLHFILQLVEVKMN